MAVHVLVDGRNQFLDIAKHATLEAVLRKIPKEALDHVQPGRSGGIEVHMEPAMALESALDLRMFVGGVVVGDQTQWFVFRRGRVDQAQELQALLMPVTFLTQADHFPMQCI